MIFDTILIHTFETKGHQASLRERLEMRKSCGPYRWTPSPPNSGRGFYTKASDPEPVSRRRLRAGDYSIRCGDTTFRLRLEWANKHLEGSRLSDTCGYFTEEDFQEDTLQPIVARLNHGRGFLAGWTMGPGMAASIDAEIYPDARAAAIAAHRMADRDAEKSREENARYQAEQDAIDAREELEQIEIEKLGLEEID